MLIVFIIVITFEILMFENAAKKSILCNCSQAAFRIRGLSRSRLRKYRSYNMRLLETGKLQVPSHGGFVETLMLFSIQDSDLLTAQQVHQMMKLPQY